VGERTRVALLGLAIAIALADSSVVTLALPEILRAYDVSIPTVAWVLVAYNLALALAAVPAAYAARRRPVLVCALGLVAFAAASLAAALAPTFAALVAARAAQALGAAAVIAAALDLLAAVTRSDARAASTWARAGVLGAALGPVGGGLLTQALGWESIFVVQVPLLLVPLAALASVPRVPPDERPAGRPHVPANAALLLASAALAAALFLLVVLLVNGWRMSPAAAGLVVTVMPLAAIASARVAPVVGSPALRSATGLVLSAGGLAALGLLPAAHWALTVPPQLLVGAGLGLTLSALTERALAGRSRQAVHGGWTIASRHAGVVLGLLLLTPLFTASLDRNERDATRAGAAAVLDSRVPPLAKLRLAQDVLAAVDDADGEVPDVRAAFGDRLEDDGAGVYERLADEIQDQLDRAVTSAFGAPFLLSAVLALAALVPVGLGRGDVSV
jgi:MFS family permease